MGPGKRIIYRHRSKYSHGHNMTPEEQKDYEATVHNVLTTVVLGSLFQFTTFGFMLLAFYLIDLGL